MYNEVLIEEGIVVSADKGFAEISLLKNENCNDCSAKIICKPKGADLQIVKVSDPYGTTPGDTVKISIKGSVILKSAFILYGVPLLLLIAAILIMSKLLNGFRFVELFSFMVGIIVMSLYYLIFFYLKSFRKKLVTPEIISFTRKS